MKHLLSKLRSFPLATRALPFLLFAGLTSCQGQFGPESAYWIYFAKSLFGAAMLAVIWRSIDELRWTISLEAVLVGAGVIVIWIGIDPFYPKLPMLNKVSVHWNPPAQFGEGSVLAFFFIVARIAGASLVVPPLEELFYRSFVYRYIVNQNATAVPLRQFHGGAFFITAIIFGFAHREWLAGIICGCAYQWLVLRRGHLGDAITAHAISNLLLGLWVVYKGAWEFW
jgi:CAAX prenyl protease-like protein